MDWLNALDLRIALRNCHQDLLFDWYRDPWGWPELTWVVTKRKDSFIVNRLNGNGAKHAEKIAVAKENFSTRPALVVDVVDRLIYQSLVDQLSLKLIGSLHPWVYGPRLLRRKPTRGGWADGRNEWTNFRDRLQANILSRAALETDVVSFFASIPVARVIDEMFSRCGENRVSRRLASMLEHWDRIPGRSGLPQRYIGSSALANMYLGPIDDILHRYGRRRASSRFLPHRAARWIDDIWLFGRDAGRLRRAQLELQDALRERGLNLNVGKTRLLEGDAVPHRVQQREHSAIDGELGQTPATDDALNDLLDRLLLQPEIAHRSSVRFVTHRMRKHRVFTRTPDLIASAHRLPHCADALARLFRDSGDWRGLGDWYVDYASSHWGRIEWSLAQFATMFPSGERPPTAVVSHADEVLRRLPSLPLAAVFAQRLAAWDPDSARLAIRDGADKAHHPMQRRVLALAALEAGDSRHYVRTLLSEFEENAVTLSMLEDRRFRKLKVVPDFEGH